MQCEIIRSTGLTFRCCASCHEDAELYDNKYASEIELNGVTLSVCCACARAVEGEPKGCPAKEPEDAGERDYYNSEDYYSEFYSDMDRQ